MFQQYASYRRLILAFGTQTVNVKGWKKVFHANDNQKRAGVALLKSGRVDFQSKLVTRGTEGHYILIKLSILQYDTTTVTWRTLC